ncbi:hypothetical protein M406DRAFT_280898, partial [Cryphonectria parasitica EP155]
MAPTAPSTKRKSLRLKATERLANPLAPRKVHRPDSAVTDSFLDTKADRARIRRATFISRITKPSSTASSRSSRKNAKRHESRRRREAQAEAAVAMGGLADALPELTAEEVGAGEAARGGKVRHRSLGSRPGALRRKERVVRGEMERFGLSLAQLSSVKEEGARSAAASATGAGAGAGTGDTAMAGAEGVPAAAASTSANRFAALRGFISATMEQNPAFANR